MKRSTYLKRLKALDHKYLMGYLTQAQYAAKREKLSKEWMRSEVKRLKNQRVTVVKRGNMLYAFRPGATKKTAGTAAAKYSMKTKRMWGDTNYFKHLKARLRKK